MKLVHRKLLIAVLVASFAAQTAMVYGDATAGLQPPMDGLALRGRELWHEHNCQACHQIYGFGGFLGPDLTNAAARLTRARLDQMLTVGNGQMPAFGLEPEQIDAIEGYLRYLNLTGVGQARAEVPVEPRVVDGVIDDFLGESPISAAGARGLQRFRTQCIACHQLFRATPLGPYLAADLTSVTSRLDAEAIDATMRDGRPARGMPPTGLSAAEREDMLALFTWLGEHRSELRRLVGAGGQTDRSLPWWEFR